MNVLVNSQRNDFETIAVTRPASCPFSSQRFTMSHGFAQSELAKPPCLFTHTMHGLLFCKVYPGKHKNSNSLWELRGTRSIQKLRRMHELKIWQFPQPDKTEHLLRPRHKHVG